MNKKMFENPDRKYRMKTIVHAWPEKCEVLADAINAFGYGGAATNPPTGNGYTSSVENLEKLGHILKALQDREMDYWIYDEQGYPSGHAGGQTLAGHPEMEAKGFYMYRSIAYEPKHVVYDMDPASDKIIWAAKYPMDCSVINASEILYEQMEKVPFTQTHCECDLKENEIFFAFCVKPSYEGSHLTHNVSSKRRYINIMDEKAVRRFLDVCYEPIAKHNPDAYPAAQAVFTDEPSLQVAYMHGDESWPYALAPWVDGLFEKFEQEYGYSLLPYLPQIFEGKGKAYTTRIRFYELIGKLIANAYVKQIADWCKDHGTCFSGHYLAEESMLAHVLYYGSYATVLSATGYPGVDVLAAYPDIYHHNTTKFAQMVSRKRGMNGIMTELCPFVNISHFEKMPVTYSAGILGLLYSGGCRCINSYFRSDFQSYAPDELSSRYYKGFMDQEQSRWINNYVGRMGTMLDQLGNDCDTFVYYGIEDVQAKLRPSIYELEASGSLADCSMFEVTRALYLNGYDYLMADREDLVKAAESMKEGAAQISGCQVKHIIIPAMDIIHSEVWEALVKLQEAGVSVHFVDRLPRYKTGEEIPFIYYDFREECVLNSTYTTDGYFTAENTQEIVQQIEAQEKEFTAWTDTGEKLLVTRYQKEDKTIYFAVNRSEQKQQVSWKHRNKKLVQIWDPTDGTVTEKTEGEAVNLEACCGTFFVFTK